jgi:hypothetical protein
MKNFPRSSCGLSGAGTPGRAPLRPRRVGAQLAFLVFSEVMFGSRPSIDVPAAHDNTVPAARNQFPIPACAIHLVPSHPPRISLCPPFPSPCSLCEIFPPRSAVLRPGRSRRFHLQPQTNRREHRRSRHFRVSHPLDHAVERQHGVAAPLIEQSGDIRVVIDG